MTRTVLTGFDSAWGGRAPGAICSLVTDDGATLRVLRAPELVDWDEAIRALADAGHENHVVAIDQGLVVPNATGMRPVERDLARALGTDFGCAAYPSNTSNLSCYGPKARVWDLVEKLAASGFHQEPIAVARRCAGRFFFECYPHPAIIGMFSLPRLLPYKVRHANADAWHTLVERLRSLATAAFPLLDVEAHVPTDLAQTKRNEDKLDALVAALVAAHLWFHGTERSTILGSLDTGYIVTPHSAATLAAYQRAFGSNLNPEGRATSVRPSAATVRGSVTAPVLVAKDGNVDRSVELLVNDTGNIWGPRKKPKRLQARNRWIPRYDRPLLLTFCDVDGQPTLRFVPFDSCGEEQKGLRICEEHRGAWKVLAAGASNKRVLEYPVLWREA